ncbi:hypothetical protein BDB01DRAFT_896477 [Pilobolus umbonatus]|nr:hypothetical protein BDB01DRAFT_896477 [Pilobolus umbonatus]
MSALVPACTCSSSSLSLSLCLFFLTFPLPANARFAWGFPLDIMKVLLSCGHFRMSYWVVTPWHSESTDRGISTLMNTLMLSHDMWNRVVHSTGDIHSGRVLLMGLNEVQDYRAPRFEFFNLTGCLLFTGVRLTEDWLSYYISPVYIHSGSLFVCSDL